MDGSGAHDAEPGDYERSRIIALLGPTPSSLDDLVRLSRTSPAIVRPCYWSSKSPDGSSATAVDWYRSCRLHARIVPH
jgi:hypothetical protein